MNYKKSKILQCDGYYYNMENWVRIGIEKGSIRKDKNGNNIKENLFFVEFGCDEPGKRMYFTIKSVKHYQVPELIGVPFDIIEAMFLQAECSDE